MHYTNAMLTVIAVLLAVIAFQQHDHRPVTIGELKRLMQEDPDAWERRREQIPVSAN